jgi:hypothetical protein
MQTTRENFPVGEESDVRNKSNIMRSLASSPARTLRVPKPEIISSDGPPTEDDRLRLLHNTKCLLEIVAAEYGWVQ